jgi:ethanolamine utilization protein EutA
VPPGADADGCVELFGLDFGSTTSRAEAATARLVRDVATGRIEVGEVAITYRSNVVFTPFIDSEIDLLRVQQYLDRWLIDSAVDPRRLIGGGTLITGLAARSPNAPALAALLRKRLGPNVLATAADPHLESWVAFMASCAELSRQHPEHTFVNLDIGGGTTNLALGRDGTVSETGALHVGARHIQVRPGSYVITALSEVGRALLTFHRFARHIGDSLTRDEVDALVGFQVQVLEAAVRGDREFFANPCARLHEAFALPVPDEEQPISYTFTGGVGELIYRILLGEALPEQTEYGDLGIELAQAIARSSILVPPHALRRIPTERARATVHGMLRHGTEISGTTIYLPRPEVLPLPDLPILARLSQRSSDQEIDQALRLAARCPQGACLQVSAGCATLAEVRTLASRVRAALLRNDFPSERPLVFVLFDNTGKLFGNYLTDWGKLRQNVVVIDEVANRHMAFVNIGRLRSQVVPVSFYGMKR